MSADHDRDIRPRLLSRLAPCASWICEEFSADGKVDIAAVEAGLLCGYEIKAARDTLTRLTLAGGAQVEMFSRTFDRVTLVCAEKHLARASALVPEWWGLTIATPCGFSVTRAPEQNPADPTPRMMRMMWATEAVALLRTHGAHKGLPLPGSFDRHGEIMHRIGALPRDVVRAGVFDALAKRDWSMDGRRKRIPMVNSEVTTTRAE